jgi:hypothetical protein
MFDISLRSIWPVTTVSGRRGAHVAAVAWLLAIAAGWPCLADSVSDSQVVTRYGTVAIHEKIGTDGFQEGASIVVTAGGKSIVATDAEANFYGGAFMVGNDVVVPIEVGEICNCRVGSGIYLVVLTPQGATISPYFSSNPGPGGEGVEDDHVGQPTSTSLEVDVADMNVPEIARWNFSAGELKAWPPELPEVPAGFTVIDTGDESLVTHVSMRFGEVAWAPGPFSGRRTAKSITK